MLLDRGLEHGLVASLPLDQALDAAVSASQHRVLPPIPDVTAPHLGLLEPFKSNAHFPFFPAVRFKTDLFD